MPYLIKKIGTKLISPAGSSFGGMVAAKRDVDTYLKSDGTWTEDRDEAHKFGMRVAAENKLPALNPTPGHELEIVEF